MSRQEPRPNRQILEEASAWFVTFRSQDPGDGARREFHEWLKRSPEHIRAYLEIASIYVDIPAPDQGHAPSELIAKARASAESNVFPLGPTGSPCAVAESPQRRSRSLSPSRVALAASILIFAFVGVWLYAERNDYRTAIGEQRSITLPDGSMVELNVRSKVRVAFGDGRRDVELLEGQALFRVAKDPSRPFVVHAGDTIVRAVGTQFDVYRKSTGTVVTVLEGRVATTTRAAGSSGPHEGEIILAAGEQVTVTPSHVEKAVRPNIPAATAWTQHQLVFDGTPLDEVLDEFSRYTTRRLIIDSPELANLRISGQYTSASPDSLLRFLSLQKGVVITHENGETHIRQE